MACRSGKQGYSTRDAAIDAQKRLVYDNYVHGRDHLSARLNVYPCDVCHAWHIGRSSLETPSCYHYNIVATLDGILEADALKPPPPQRMELRRKRQLPRDLLLELLDIEEQVGMMWFTWDGAWDFSRAPHPGTFLNYPVAECRHLGIMRIAVPAFVAKLRWSDYVQRNKTTRHRREHYTSKGNPAQWLATDAAVPCAAFRSIDVWYRGRWVAVDDVSDDDFDAWLEKERP